MPLHNPSAAALPHTGLNTNPAQSRPSVVGMRACACSCTALLWRVAFWTNYPWASRKSFCECGLVPVHSFNGRAVGGAKKGPMIGPSCNHLRMLHVLLSPSVSLPFGQLHSATHQFRDGTVDVNASTVICGGIQLGFRVEHMSLGGSSAAAAALSSSWARWGPDGPGHAICAADCRRRQSGTSSASKPAT
jgi:hypothetical protein